MRPSHPRLIAATAVSAALALAPAASAAQIVLDPPGKAGANQYFETIPTSNGNAAPPSGGVPTKPPAIDASGPGRSTLHQLQKLGADGHAAANFAQQSAPVISHAGRRDKNGKAGSTSSTDGSRRNPGVNLGATAAAATTGDSGLGEIFHVLGGSDAGGIGLFLPILLIGSLVSAIVAAGWRRRREDSPSAPPA
jgi:hypothetical protein